VCADSAGLVDGVEGGLDAERQLAAELLVRAREGSGEPEAISVLSAVARAKASRASIRLGSRVAGA